MNWKRVGFTLGAVGAAYLLFSKAGSRQPQLIDVVDSLPRAAAFDKRDLSKIEFAVVHHTAGSRSDTPETIAAYHVNSRGFKGIGYHIVITQDGKIYLCNRLDSVSSHVGGKNLSSIGISCVGNFENYDIPAAQYRSLLSVLSWLQKEFKGIKIVPHQKFSTTACPGNFLMARLFPNGKNSPSAIGAIITKDSLKNTTRCADGSFSNAKKMPCLTRGGAHKTQKSIFEVFKLQTGGNTDKCLNAMGFPYFDTFLVPLEVIHTDEESFQNRRAKYSKESAGKIIDAVQSGKFLWGVFDPIILWLDPQDKKLYVLSGHSRFNAFKQLLAMGLSANGRSFDKIPAKIIETDYKTAKQIALNSNALATPETLLERTYYYRALLDSGIPQEEVKNTIKRMELGNWTLVWAWVHLNPDGKAMDALRMFEGKDITSNENLKQVTYWLGSTREKFPQLSNFHENEMFDFLMGGGYGKKFSRLPDFQEKVRTILASKETMFSTLDPEQPLNLDVTTTKSVYRQEWEIQVNELKRKISELQAERTKRLQTLKKENASRADIDKALEQLDKAIRTQEIKLAEALKNKGNVLTAERSAPSLFGIAGMREIPANAKAGDMVFLPIEVAAQAATNKAFFLDPANDEAIARMLYDLYFNRDFDELTAGSISNIAAVAAYSPNTTLRAWHTQLIDNLRYYYTNIANALNYE
jgi:hypothetical protein